MKKEQKIMISTNAKEQIAAIIHEEGIKKLLLVCDSAFPFLMAHQEYLDMEIPYVIFDEFTPNPLYTDVCKGIEIFHREACDGILAIGGGSAIDVAKCIKLFSSMPEGAFYLEQEYRENDVILIAVPTTSGTGSESTRYAVIYHEGQKQSVTHESIIPAYALLDRRNLQTLPLYQKKCTMLDALCQGIESWWSVNANEESRKYSAAALSVIMENMQAYLDNEEQGNENMMLAANYAGRAINITQTTAAHAMSYKLTSLYKIPHGRAAFMCLPQVWEYMIKNTDSSDRWQQDELEAMFADIAKALNCDSPKQAIAFLKELDHRLFEKEPVKVYREDLDLLAGSVNATRLKNNPVRLSKEVLYQLYEKMVRPEHQVKLLVFDWAGTTVDYGCIAPLAVFEKIFESKGICLSREEILKPMGMGKRDHIKTLLLTENAGKQWREKYGRDWNEDDVDDMFGRFNAELLSVLHDYCEPIEGVVETLGQLREEGLLIGSTTGYTREMMDIVEEGAKKAGYAPDHVVTSEMTGGYGRPYPYMLFENMRHFAVYPPACVVKVGDTAADMKEGKNAGAWSVGVIEGSSAANMTLEMAQAASVEVREERFAQAEKILRDAGADYVIRTMRELPAVIAQIDQILSEGK